MWVICRTWSSKLACLQPKHLVVHCFVKRPNCFRCYQNFELLWSEFECTFWGCKTHRAPDAHNEKCRRAIAALWITVHCLASSGSCMKLLVLLRSLVQCLDSGQPKKLACSLLPAQPKKIMQILNLKWETKLDKTRQSNKQKRKKTHKDWADPNPKAWDNVIEKVLKILADFIIKVLISHLTLHC